MIHKPECKATRCDHLGLHNCTCPQEVEESADWEDGYVALLGTLMELSAFSAYLSSFHHKKIMEFIRSTRTQAVEEYKKRLLENVVGVLEGMKRDQDAPKESDPHFTGCGGCGEDYPAICGCREVNQALSDAQTAIKKLLDDNK